MATATRKIVLAGGSGFLGQLLADWFDRLDWDVVVLARRKPPGIGRFVRWDGKTVGSWAAALEGATALVNLAGVSVNCRYYAQNRRAIMDSRVEPTRVLGQAIQGGRRPPQVWLNSSTATIYKHSFDRPMDELNGLVQGTPEARDLFSIEVAKAWEHAFEEALVPGTRKVALRTAMVFGTRPGTVYRVLRRLVGAGLGGAMAGGRQYVSWIHQDDFCRAVQWLIERPDLCGVVNLAAPNPLTNREMMRAIRAACHVPFGLPASRWMLEIGTFLLRTEAELVIKSRRVVPTRLSRAGFEFEFVHLTQAVADLERRLAKAPAADHEADSVVADVEKKMARNPA